ncbi:ribokinase [Cricetibacter osteomyelitidis]|uniref:Ribokinase n=1 Tax=Cricetibacter osteomyelitidis TaxID=1521931 RepID=A0A4R2T7L3_9PAST|nr:ribokinase [Cricetibacter osteomyelitidis]TCP96844.1 ribokinase [Cricetibacter osteomyelitidis]
MKKVIVVGSLHYDIVVEASHRPVKGETILGQKWFPKFGGKGGNQAVAAAKAGCSVTMVSAVGNDDFSAFLLNRLKQSNINTNFIQHIDSASSGMSVAIMDAEGDYGAVVVSGANLLIDTQQLKNEHLWENAAMLILQNEVAEKVNIAAAQQARQHNVPVCLNAAPAKILSPQLIELIDILIVNAVEAENMCGIRVINLDSALEAALILGKQFRQVIVTAGGDGVAYTNQQEQGYVPSIKVKLISTLGAGDCFVGHLCASLIDGTPLSESVKHANRKAAEHVSMIQS